MSKDYKEWFLQSSYDLEVAEKLFNSGEYIYCVFLCHLSVEKYLKGIYLRDFQKEPPKIHSLTYFITKLQMVLNEENKMFLSMMNEVATMTRYPESLKTLSKEYEKGNAEIIFRKSKEFLLWLMKR